MGRTKSFINNFVTAALLQLFTVAAGFIVPRIMLVKYGSELNGLVTSITQFISIFQSHRSRVGVVLLYTLCINRWQTKIGRVLMLCFQLQNASISSQDTYL